MGCSESEEVWQQKLEAIEDKLIELSGVNCEKSWVEIDMEDPKIGKPIRIRKFAIGNDEAKKTLVWCHGFGECGCSDSNLWKPLSEKYNLVFFDNFGWGANERISDSIGLDSREAAKTWYEKWAQKAFEALKLPPKILLAGHSFGGHLAATWASQNIDRVEALFLMSPGGMHPYDPSEDVYDKRNPENPTGPRFDKKATDKMIKENEEMKRHFMADLNGVPGGMIKSMIKQGVRQKLEKKFPEYGADKGKPAISEPYIVAICDYQAQMTLKHTSKQ